MDKVSTAAIKMSADFSIEPVKEPRGFIRLIEVILAIFAFATVCSFNSSIKFDITCNKTIISPYEIKFAYPFSLTSDKLHVTECVGKPKDLHLAYGPKGPAEFYVFVGVMAMLYTIGIFVIYIFFDDFYRKNNRVIIGDFVVTVVWTFLWLVSSAVWAQGVVDLKTYTDPASSLFSSIESCSDKSFGGVCKTTYNGNFAGVNVSVVFGFLNVIVWGGNCWFLWKETPWFKKSEEDYIPDPGTVTTPTADSNSPAPLY